MIYGYLSDKENLQKFKTFNISKNNIYTTREELFNIVKFEDTIIFENIDNLGKSFEEIKSNFDYLIIHGVILQFLEQPILNTFGKDEDTLKTISFLLQYFIEKHHPKKENKTRGRKSIYKNLTQLQKENLKNFYCKEISLKEVMALTGFSRATVYKLKKLLFPSNKKDFQKEVNDWIDGKITLKQCMEKTDLSRSYLYVLKKKQNVKKDKFEVSTNTLLPEDKILYPVKYLSEETDFSKLPKFGKIVKFSINPKKEYIDYSYGYDKYSEMTEVYKIEKINKNSIYFMGEKFTKRDFKYKNNIFIYYNHLTAKKDLDNEIKNKLIFYFSQIELKYKKYHLKLFKNIISLKQPFKEYISSLSQDEKRDLFLRIKSEIFLNTRLKSEDKKVLEDELKSILMN